MADRIMLFGGTTEGRELARLLAENGIACTVSDATAYGTQMMVDAGRRGKPADEKTAASGTDKGSASVLNGTGTGDKFVGRKTDQDSTYAGFALLEGRMDHREMAAHLLEAAKKKKPYLCVVDATHPYATVVSREIKTACQETGTLYLRLRRVIPRTKARKNEFFFDTLEEAAEFLRGKKGTILSTLGVREASPLADMLGDRDRLFVRVLPSVKSIEQCREAGFSGKQILAMQGPFSTEMNIAMLRQVGAAFLLTKESGDTGGFSQKREAAAACGAECVILRSPEHQDLAERGGQKLSGAAQEGEASSSAAGEGLETYEADSFSGIVARLSKLTGRELRSKGKRSMVLAGIGPGAADCRTEAVDKAIREADILFGAGKVLDTLEEGASAALRIDAYKGAEIAAYLRDHPEYSKVVVLFSGDSGFYSGAGGVLAYMKREMADIFSIQVLPGISSLSCFCARLGISYQDVKLLSIHGREANVIGNLRFHRKCFLLLSDGKQAADLGQALVEAEKNGILTGVKITYGLQLTCPEEEVGELTPEALSSFHKDGLLVLLLENPGADEAPRTPGLPDTAFIRGKVPMTKEEVRALILSKLRLTEKAVFYDVGSGTGSVSVEAALLFPDAKIYAIEQKEEAADLTRRNLEQFALGNAQVIRAKAPEGMEDLPAPTHAFIGGSGGQMKEILEALFAKNKDVRIVISCITLETLSAIQDALQELGIEETDIVQVLVNRVQKLGRYHALRGQDPVFLICCGG